MKNNRSPNGKGGTYKSAAARAFERDFMLQVRPEHRKELGSWKRVLRATVTIWYGSRRNDVDAELIFDLLQKAHVVRNDRFIRQKFIFGEIDKRNPRVEIEIQEL